MDGNSGTDSLRNRPGGEWLYDGSLDEVVEMNRQALGLLVAMAEHPLRATPLFDGEASVWRDVPVSARERLATSPCLLADASFDDGVRWRSARQVAEPSACEPRVFSGRGSEEFIHRVLVLGWHLARADRQLARMVLGMSRDCADQLLKLRLRDIDWLAQHRPGWVRPRWERQPRLWRNLLLSAKQESADELLQFRARGLQLLAAASLPTVPTSIRLRSRAPRQVPVLRTLHVPA